jgi:lactoylglutathione lyase
MLPVGDLDRSIDFYTGMLGMSLVRERRSLPTPTAYVAYGPEDTSPALELISGTGKSDKPWHGHIAISVQNLQGLCEKLEGAGVPFRKKLQAGGPTSSNAFYANIFDPDGFEIELCQPRD